MSTSDAAAEAAAIAAAQAAARTFNITLWTLYAFGVVVTALRTYARVTAVGWKNFEADDYLVWLAVVSAKWWSTPRPQHRHTHTRARFPTLTMDA
jgi:hypothetical protein